MHSVGAQPHIHDLQHRAGIELAIEVRKQIATARRLPLQRITKCVRIDRDEKKPALTGEVLCGGAGHLRRRREMNEAVPQIVCTATVSALALGFAPG